MKFKSIYLLYLFSIIFSCSKTSNGQKTFVLTDVPNEITISNNQFENQELLNPFLEKLRLREKDSIGSLSIVHIGDSHIQADMGTELLRKNFQDFFGSPGRGLIVPIKVAKSNEPSNYKTFSEQTWKYKRAIAIEDTSLPIGIGGFTIFSNQKKTKLRIQTYDKYGLNHSFNTIGFFIQPKEITKPKKQPFNITIYDTLENKIMSINPKTSVSGYFKVILPDTFHAVDIVFGEKIGHEIYIFGLLLENQNKGVHYHSIGVNGAQYFHYNASKYFFTQLSELKPDLIIVSLGTNESFYPKYSPEKFYHQIDTFVTNIKKYCKKTPIILTTPVDHYKNGVSNVQLESVREEIIRYAKNNHLILWDLYQITGGKNSCENWKKAELLQKDGVHFTRKGYQLQANILFDVFYHEFIRYRHSKTP